MKLLIHDLEKSEIKNIFKNSLDEMMVFSKDDLIHHCIGCFECWIKTPGVCVIEDDYKDMGGWLAKCEKLIIISKCSYGGFSPFVKNVLDRSIPYIHPYFVIINGEMHHRRRYQNNIDVQVCFYGDNLTEKEKHTAQKLVEANAINLYWEINSISFIEKPAEMEGSIS